MTAEITGLVVAVAAYAVSWAIAEAVRRNAVRLNLVQNPNERSSHITPTPSGGGIGIAIAGTAAGLVIMSADGGHFWPLLAVGAIAAIAGLLDDRFELSSRLRLLLQFLMVGALLLSISALPPIVTPIGMLPQPVFYVALIFAGVWWFNLFNFMDGIDGIAGAEAIFILVGAITLAALSGYSDIFDTIILLTISIVAACAGFVMLNWPPARIFMGDAGSNYLAVTIFGIMLLFISERILGYPAWAILVAGFVTDATVTLVRRASHGERLAAAHRLHAYQKLSRRWKSHRAVTLAYLGINIVWLYPAAYVAQTHPNIAWFIVGVAYAPIIGICIVAGAGIPENQTAERTRRA